MLGKAALLSRKENTQSNKRKETDDFFAAFSHQATDEQKILDIEETIEIEIWETNKDIFEIYRILQHYFKEYYTIDTYLLNKLVIKRDLDLEEVLLYIPYIHATYVDKVMPTTEEANG